MLFITFHDLRKKLTQIVFEHRYALLIYLVLISVLMHLYLYLEDDIIILKKIFFWQPEKEFLNVISHLRIEFMINNLHSENIHCKNIFFSRTSSQHIFA